MPQEELLDLFVRFGLAAALGFLIGLERAMGARENPHAGLRDFVLFALLGAISALVATIFDNSWLIAAGFLGFLALLLLAYWADRSQDDEDTGITTEAAPIARSRPIRKPSAAASPNRTKRSSSSSCGMQCPRECASVVALV